MIRIFFAFPEERQKSSSLFDGGSISHIDKCLNYLRQRGIEGDFPQSSPDLLRSYIKSSKTDHEIALGKNDQTSSPNKELLKPTHADWTYFSTI